MIFIFFYAKLFTTRLYVRNIHIYVENLCSWSCKNNDMYEAVNKGNHINSKTNASLSYDKQQPGQEPLQ